MRNRLCLLKNSCFVKTAEIWQIENVRQNGHRRLLGFLLQSFFCECSANEFFNRHAWFRQSIADRCLIRV